MKKKGMSLTFCRGDLVALGVVTGVIVLAGGILRKNVSPGGERMAVIYQNGKVIQKLSLEGEKEFSVGGIYHNRIVVKDGKAAIVKSDCPGGDCVHSGWIGEAGRSIVCLPNGVEVRIEGTSEVDSIVR